MFNINYIFLHINILYIVRSKNHAKYIGYTNRLFVVLNDYNKYQYNLMLS